MDYLWSPWRYRYVSQAGKGEGCPFCQKVALDPSQDREHLVLFRGKQNFILLNLFPYTTGHMLVTPYAHVAELDQVSAETVVEMMGLAQRLQAALKKCYNPEGYNLGMNIGKWPTTCISICCRVGRGTPTS